MAVGARDETVKIFYIAFVYTLASSSGEFRHRSAVETSECEKIVAVQTPQAATLDTFEQFLKPFERVFNFQPLGYHKKSHLSEALMTREISIVTPEHVELSYELAGIGSRFYAITIDTILCLAVFILLGVLAVLFSHMGFSKSITLDHASPWLIAAGILVTFVFFWGYFLFFETRYNGQTPGKMVAGIRVVQDSGHPIDFRAALLRNLVRFVDWLPGMYCVGFLTMFFSPQYRRVGDYVAGTLVVKTRRGGEKTPDTVKSTVADGDSLGEQSDSLEKRGLPEEALTYLRAITKDDYRAIRYFLDRRKELEEAVALPLAAKMANPIAQKLHLEMTTLEDPVDFLETVCTEWERRMVH